jgi:hypothetical protein
MNTGERRGYAGPGKTRKTKTTFPSFPTALGNRCCDSHISTAPATVPFSSENDQQKNHRKESGISDCLILSLQAHSWIRKCYIF